MNLKKLLLPVAIAIASLFSGTATLAQVSTYTFAQSTGTYVPITGGTVLATATANSGTVPSLDGFVDSITTMPFPFVFDGLSYTKCYVSANGFITFGTVAPTTSLSAPISSSVTTMSGVIAPWARDINAVYELGTPPATGEIRYETIGTAPNRQLVIQWANFRPTYSSSTTSAYVFDFQVILEETTNKIYVKYGGLLGYLLGSASYASTVQIGLRGATNADFNNRTNTTSVNFTGSAAGTSNSATQAFSTSATPPGMPTSGLTYTWTPPTCLTPTGVTASSITSGGATLNWTAPATAPSNGYEYEVRSSGAAGSGATGLAASGNTGAGVTTAPVTGLAANTTYTVYVRGFCGGTDYSTWTAAVTFTTLCNAYSAPFMEGFNSGSLPNCWTNTNSISSTTANLLWRFSGAPGYGTTSNGRPVGTYAWVDASSPYNAVVTLTSPVINLSSLTAPYLKFDWFKNNNQAPAGYANNNLMVEGYNGTAWVTLFDDTSNSSVWRTVEFLLPASFNGVANAQFRFSVDKSLSNDFYDDLLLDSISIVEAPTCFAPTGVTASSITTSGATLNWTAPATAPSNGYQYEVRTSGAAGSGATGLAASGNTGAGVTTAPVTGLAAATTYTVYVRGFCGGTDYSNWTVAYTFTTLCDAINVPYTENFDAVTTPALPNCTIAQDVNADNKTWATSSGTANSAPNKLAYTYHTSNAANDWWFTPGLNLVSGTVYQITFKYRGSGTTYPEKLEVKAGTSQNAAAMTGTALWSDANITNSTYQTATINYTATATGVHYFGWHAFSAANMNYLYVDDISIIEAPSCLPPTGVTASSITSGGATLNWTASISAPTSGYEYEVRSSGAAGSGATGLAASGNTGAGVTTAPVTGLAANTTYTVYVRSNCGSGSYSTWTAAVTFTTLCNAYSAPFMEGFNSGSLPNCWTNTNSISSTTANLLWRFSGTPDYGTTANGRPAGTYAWVDASSPHNAVVTLTSPVINLSTLTSPYLKFDWFKNNTDPSTTSTNNNLMVEGYNGTAWVTLFDDTSNSNVWRTVEFLLPASFNGVANAQFRFSVDKSLSNNYYDDLLLDSISIVEAPTCFAPTGVMASSITTSGATLNWTAPATAPSNGYQYEVRSSGAAGSGATGLAASGNTGAGVTTAPVTGLAANTTYTVYVRGFCGGTDYSNWTVAYTFTTLCDAINVPYTENFDAVTTPALPNCSFVENVNGDNKTWATSSGTANSAPNKLAYTYHTSNAANDWWFTPGLNLVSGTVYKITFAYRSSGTSYPEKLEVKAGTSQNAAAMTGTALWSDANITNSTYQTATINYTATATGVHYFGWHVFSDADMNYLYVDDVSIVEIPVCNGTPNPGATLANNTSICLGDQVKLYPANHSLATGLTYQWYASTDGGVTFTAVTGATSDTLLASPSVNTTYQLEVTCTNSSLADTTTPLAITFNSNITSVTADTICGPGTATLMAAGATGDSIRWYDAETGGTLLATTTGSFTTSVISATTTFYAQAVGGTTEFVGPTYSGTSTNGTNVGDHGIVISTTVPNVHIVSADIPFTGTGDITVQLQTNSGTPVQTFVATGVTGAGSTAVTVPLDITVPAPGNYRLLITALSGTVGSLGYSSGVTYPYTATSGVLSVVSGFWYGADMSSNMYLFNLGVSTQCASPRVPVVAIVSQPFTVDLGADTTICSGDPIILDAGITDATYSWSNGAATQTISVSTAGTYSVEVSNGACSATDTIVVDEVLPPVAGMIVVGGEMPAYEFTAPGSFNAVTYAWDFGDGATGTGDSVGHTYTANGDYTVVLTVTNECGVAAADSVVVNVNNVGINTVAGKATAVQVYPNPSNGLTVVEAKGATIASIEAMDNLGRIVLRTQPNTSKAVIDVKGMAQGTYTLRIQTDKGNSTVKLVVKD